MRTLRWIIAGVFALLAAASLLAAFAGIGAGVPWRAETAIELDAAKLVAGDALVDEQPGLLIRGADAGGLTVVLQPVDPVDARQLRYFTLRLDEVPGVLRAVVVWRVDGSLQAAPLPGAFHDAATVDLWDSPQWNGTIDAIGFALLPTDYLAAVATMDRALRFIDGRIETDSASARLRELLTQWRAYRPWNGRSNHTSGFELSTVPGPSLQLFVFCMLLVALATAAIGGGRHALRATLVPALALALLIPAIRQVAQIGMRAQVAAEAQAAVDRHPEWPLSASPPLANDAQRLLATFDARPPRIAVWGESGFMREYPTYLLRAANAASLNHPSQLESAGAALPGTVLVLAGAGGWQLDTEGRQLQLEGRLLEVEPLMRGTMLQAFRIRSELR